MRLLLLQNMIHFPSLGGANKANRALFESLAGRGHEARVVAPALGSHGPASLAELESHLAGQGVAAERGAEGLRFSLGGVGAVAVARREDLVPAAAREIGAFRPDRVLVSSEDPGQQLLAAALETAAERTAAIVHTPLYLPFGPAAFLESAAGAERLRRVRGIVTVSRWLQGYLEQGGCASEVLPFPVYGAGPFPALGRFGEGLVMLVNPCAYKGLPIFLELARRRPDVAFAAVLTWGTTAADRAALTALPNVTLLPAEEDVARIFARTSVLLMPSLWPEAFGMLAVEAMLHGIPVLASDSGGLPEAKLGVPYVLPVRPIEGYEARFDEREFPVARVPEQDAGPWEAALARLLSDRAHYEEIAGRSRQAAHGFVAGIDIARFEKWLERLESPTSTVELHPEGVPDVSLGSQRSGDPRSESQKNPHPEGVPGLRSGKAQALSGDARILLALKALKARKTESPAGKPAGIPLQPRAPGATFPLSFAQERLWFLDRLEPGQAAYIVANATRLRGRLDLRAFAAATAAVVARHEILRTSFSLVDDAPVQVTAPAGPVPRAQVDLGALPPARREPEALAQAARLARVPFDLARLPLFRLAMFALADEERLLLAAFHHAISDGWSAGVFLRELVAVYREEALPPLALQYADYAVWQRTEAAGQAQTEKLARLAGRLRGAPPTLDLPLTEDPKARRGIGRRIPVALPPALAREVEALAGRHGATPFMVLLAALGAVLSRWSGQDDLVIGSPVAGRTRSELEGLIGLFVNSLALRLDLAGDPPFSALLEQARGVALEAQGLQDVPFERLVSALNPERIPGRNPIFQVMLIFQNTPPARLEKPGLALEAVALDTGAARFDLLLELTAGPAGLAGYLEWDAGLLEEATARRLAEGFAAFLAGALARPEERLADLPLLSPGERWQLLQEWNDTARAVPGETLHGWVFAWAAERPDAVAVTADDGSLTYGELARRACWLAAALVELGVAAETPVGVGLSRTSHVPVALLGILAAGGAYVPLDPHQPAERLAGIAEDARLRALVTESALLPGFLRTDPSDRSDPTDRSDPGNSAVPRLLLERWKPPSREAPLPPEASASQLAYVLFTSGSTGRPKGVMVSHGAVVSFLASMAEAPGMTVGETLAAVTTLAFDIAGLEIFLPLTTGGRVLLLSRETAGDAAALAGALVRHGAHLLQATPATWRLLGEAESELARLSPPLRRLCGGEALPRDLADRVAAGGPLWNLYGPTETTIWSALSRVEPGPLPVAIGRPIGNTLLVAAGRHGEAVPWGVPGELLIGGAGVARGYRGRPDLTAERFVPDAASGRAGERLYRTGDQVRARRAGTFEFLGRLDHQVKLRGFRIEPGEIEHALLSCPGVTGAVVALARTPGGEPRLVAFVATAEERFDAAAAARHLASRLPDYMVPAAFAVLPAFPLTPNGKVDRQALARLAESTAAGMAQAGEVEPPRGPLEEILAGIWRDLLGISQVSRTTHFFDAGGHSLLAARLVARVRRALGVELPLAALFERPTLAGMAGLIEGADAARPATQVPIQLLPRGGPLPLSFSQRRLWFFEQWLPGTAVFNIPLEVELRGELLPALLAACFAAVARRHETLRSRFEDVGGEPWAVIEGEPRIALPEADLSALPPAHGLEEAARLARLEARQPFDLARGPLARTLLLRLAPDLHRLVVTLHHAVADGWSMGILVEEIGALYSAGAGRAADLPALPVHYADFAAWQTAWLSGEELARQVDFWKERLAGAPAALALPLDRPRGTAQSYAGRRRPLSLPENATRRLLSVSRAAAVTPFMTLLAGWSALLARLADQPSVTTGTLVANRNDRELEGLIGFFANTLALNVPVEPAASFSDLLAACRESTLGAFAHQELPFEKLVEELNPERDLAFHPLFQVLFLFQNAPGRTLDLPGLALSSTPIDKGTTNFDLVLALGEEGETFAGSLDWNTEIFDATTAARLAGQLLVLLEGATAEPATRVADLPLLAAAERHQLVVEWNDTAAAGRAEEETIVDALARHAAERGSETAAVCGPASLTYGDLWERSGHLAGALARRGVGRGDLVALLADRGLDFLLSVVALYRLGAAYLPLDPLHPVRRQEQILAQSGAVLLIRGPLLDDLLAEQSPIPHPHQSAAPGDLAYVLYTSGSTGIPKGVMIEHRGMTNHLEIKVADLGLMARDRVAQNASQCFDISVWQLFAPLFAGGVADIVPDETAHDPVRLLTYAESAGLTILEVVPSLLLAMVEDLERRDGSLPDLRRLRRLVPTGEALPADLCRRWLALYPGIPLLNAYGPTECSDDVAHLRVAAPEEAGEATAPIGRPLANLALYVLDPRLTLLPAGVAGELAVAGTGVGRGYLGEPGRTAAVFVPDAFADRPGGRLYRTGDLARLAADGRIEFLGRLDHQVKVRGFRIELGEIEAVLRGHPAVAAAVVAVKESGAGARLTAYLVPHSEAAAEEGQALEPERLRGWLLLHLPDYMVPAAFVVLPELPLTANGKVDHRALPEPEEGAETRTAMPPRTPTEARLAEIWREVLPEGRELRFGVTDSFFAVGGHSLLATRVMARVRATFGVELPLRDLFEEPTIEGFARRLDAVRREDPTRLAIPASPSAAEVPLSFAQERLWFLDQLTAGSGVYNLPVALSCRGRLDVAALARTCRQIVARHEALRTVFPAVSGQPWPVVRPAGDVPLPVVDLAALPEPRRSELARRLAAAEAERPFDLATGPLLRTALVRLEEGDHLLLATLHHIAADAWSMWIFVREVGQLYESESRGEPPTLEPLPIQYRDFARFERDTLAGKRMEALLAHWRERLDGGLEPLSLPTDRPRPAEQTARGAVLARALPRELGEAVYRAGREHRATPFMVLLAAFSALLHRLTRQSDFGVGTLSANRDRIELEGLIGCFINTLVLRCRPAGGESFADGLAQARAVALDAFAGAHVPFARLVEEIRPDRDLSRPPLAQVLLVLQNVPAAELALPGLTLAQLPNPHAASPFDMAWYFEERDGTFAATLEYNVDLFDRPTLGRFFAGFETLLAGALAAPATALADLPLLPEAERFQVTAEWNDTAAPPPPYGRLDAWIEAVAAAHPEAPAVVAEGGRLTYGELWTRAGSVARSLVDRGVGPDTFVGICGERSGDLFVALVAVLRAGGAYLPLDPAWPADRLTWFVRDSGARLVLTWGKGGGLAWPEGAAAVPLAEAEAPADGPAPPAAGDPDHLAYAIYTSGSTGRPKGVMVTHATLGASTWARFLFYRRPAERYLLLSSFAFDSSVAGIFWTLVSGGTLVLPGEEPHLDLPRLLALVERFRPTHLLALPSLYRALLETAGTAGGPLGWRFSGLDTVIVAGEACPPELVALHGAALGDVPLWNEYGPTEGTVWCSAHDARLLGPSGAVPIGRPIPGYTLHLLDAALRPVPVGVPAEVYLGGVGVTRGYLGRPDATAERFLPDPFAAALGGRLYRTGDLARLAPDGTLEFLGRADHQVKIRGFRVELPEIERVLAEHPRVAEAVVKVAGEAGRARLVAFVTPAASSDSAALSPADLRAFLTQRLPEYMVPALYRVLADLPRTPNGKLDREALPLPGAERPALAVPLRVPETPAEAALAALWAQVLAIEEVGVDDRFTDLGGDSLLGLTLVGRARRAGFSFVLRDLFAHQTVARLAAENVWTGPREEVAEAREERAGEPFPLSALQQGILFHELFEKESDAYFVDALYGAGELDTKTLGDAWGRLVKRHGALRTVFRVEGLDEPRQVVLEEAPPSFRFEDWIGLTPEKQEERLAGMLAPAERRKRKPDPEVGPLVTLTVFRLGTAEHRLLFSYHHLVLDGASVAVLMGELEELYRGEGADLPAPLPYRALVEFRQERDLASDEAWFRHELEGISPQTAGAPSPSPVSGEGTGERATVRTAELTPDLTATLAAAARRQGVTLSAILETAWAAVLAGLSGRSEAVVGVTVSGRHADLPGAERGVGLYINTLPLRVPLPPATGFAELVRQVHLRHLDLEERAAVPLPLVKRWSGLGGGEELFSELYVVGPPPPPGVSTPGYRTSASSEDLKPREGRRMVARGGNPGRGGEGLFSPLTVTDRTHYRASLEVSLGPPVLLRLVFDERFGETAAERHLAALARLLKAVATTPDLPLSELPLLSSEERRQLLTQWTGDAFTPRDDGDFSARFRARAALTPGAPAVRSGGESLTYAELADRTARAAARFAALGVETDTVVALLADRGIDLLVAILGIFEAGGSYLPLDPAYPPERIRRILESSGTRILAGSVEHLESLPMEALPSRAPRLVPFADLSGGEPLPALAERPSDRLAYVIYTSGSSGLPKGAMLAHRGMLNHLEAKIADLPLGPGDVVAQTASQCFDISVWQFLAALQVGGTVEIFPDEVTHDPARLAGELARTGITVFETVPSLLSLLLDEVEAGTAEGDLSGLRWLIPTGEALPPELVRRWLARYPGIPLLNAYGPTECSDDITHEPVRRLEDLSGPRVPIGRPVRGMALYLLDGVLHPVPWGVPGELYAAGAGMGRGYLGDGARTALAFVPDAVSGRAGERLYKTGDRVRALPDGRLDFLGRVDFQVKVRGFRIELGEIETVLAACPGVRQAVVADRELAPGDTRLVAWVVPESRPGPATEELRRQLALHLPEYMVPAAFVSLDRLPLSANGKVDRKALPSPDAPTAGSTAAYTAPQSEVEVTVAAVWSEVLGVPRVGVSDNFFDLGGHSLLLVQVLARLRRRFPGELAMVDLFRHPTVASLAAHLTRAQEGGETDLARRMERGGSRREAAARGRERARELVEVVDEFGI